MKTFCKLTTTFVATVALTFFSGCGDSKDSSSTSSTPTDAAAGKKGGESHGHGAGPHEGALADWGGGKYHVEFTVDHDKKESVVYILGSDEKTPKPVKADHLLLNIKAPDFQVELSADPLKGEADGTSSRFVGTHDKLGIVQEFQGTISGEVDGTPYVGEFKEEPPADE